MVNESTTDLLVPENALAGLIPTQIGQLGHLTQLFLGSNQLTGACGETSLIAIGKRVYHSPVLMRNVPLTDCGCPSLQSSNERA